MNGKAQRMMDAFSRKPNPMEELRAQVWSWREVAGEAQREASGLATKCGKLSVAIETLLRIIETHEAVLTPSERAIWKSYGKQFAPHIYDWEDEDDE